MLSGVVRTDLIRILNGLNASLNDGGQAIAIEYGDHRESTDQSITG
ncbi:MAG: hypothetical protein AAFU78_04735 [Cyanobacteria bacterium J06633_2]